jgi:hypothetical protein
MATLGASDQALSGTCPSAINKDNSFKTAVESHPSWRSRIDRSLFLVLKRLAPSGISSQNNYEKSE